MRSLLQNPVLARELRTRIRGARATIIISIYLGLIGLITLLVYATFYDTGRTFDNPESGSEIGRAIFLTVMTVALVQVCIITPSLTAGAIAGERERQSFDLLITTLLSPFQIIIGKLSSALAFAMLLIISSLPLAGIAFLFGGVSATELLIAIAGLFATAMLFASIGIFWSTVLRTTLGATVVAQGTTVLGLLGIPFFFLISTVLFNGFIGDPSPLYIVFVGGMLCLHPFIALGLTQASLLEGDDIWLIEIPSTVGPLMLPSPWIVYLILAAILTIFFLTLSTRLLRPSDSKRHKPARSEAAS